MTRRAPLALALALLAGCGDEEILHGLAEPQANEVLVALYDSGIDATKRRDGGAEGSWAVAVAASDAARAQRALAERSLPRAPPVGFANVFAKASMVPTPTE